MFQLTPEEMKNDFAALMCVQQRPPEQFEAVTETCEQVLWTYKNELTKGGHLIQQVEEVKSVFGFLLCYETVAVLNSRCVKQSLCKTVAV